MESPGLALTASREVPSARCAFVTFLMCNDSYLPGALMLAHGLRSQCIDAELVCLTTPHISADARFALGRLFDHVIDVEPIFVPHKRRQHRQDRPYWFTRLNALRLGRDGDLGLAYDKIVLLDADVLPLRRYGELLGLPAPAGILNECKAHMVQTSSGGCVSPSICLSGRWNWHDIYEPACGHGMVIPRAITDRVASDPSNMGVNGGLLVIEPSMRELHEILADIQRPEIARLVGDRFEWPDMQYLTMRWSGRWTNVDVRFAGLNGHPCPRLLNGIHFAGVKPWSFGRTDAMERFSGHADFQLWFSTCRHLFERAHPELLRIRQLLRLDEAIGRCIRQPILPCGRTMRLDDPPRCRDTLRACSTPSLSLSSIA
jgi:glycogenin glucosyltransferase